MLDVMEEITPCLPGQYPWQNGNSFAELILFRHMPTRLTRKKAPLYQLKTIAQNRQTVKLY